MNARKPFDSPSMRLGYLGNRPTHDRKSHQASTLYGMAAWLHLGAFLSAMVGASTSRAHVLGIVVRARTSLWLLPVMAQNVSNRIDEPTLWGVPCVCWGSVPQELDTAVVDVVGVPSEARGTGGFVVRPVSCCAVL